MAAQEQNQPSKIEQTARAATSRTVSRAVSKAVSQATSKALAAAGSVAGPIGTAVGGVVGKAIGDNAVDMVKTTGKGLAALSASVGSAIAGLAGAAAGGAMSGLAIASSMTVAGAAAAAIFTAFVLFIVNNSAYITTPGSLSGGIDIGEWGSIEVGASCPIPNGQILEGSYGNPITYQLPFNHGENAYWDSLPATCSSYSLPWTGTCYSNQPGDYCYTAANSCDYYGYAADLIYPGIQAAGQPVFLPYIEGAEVNWVVEWSGFGSTGQARGVLSTSYNGSAYEIYVTHLQQLPTGGVSGTPFGTLYAIGTPHLHIELRIDGEFVPPEFMCTGGSIVGGNYTEVGCYRFPETWPEDLIDNEMEAAEIIMSNTAFSDQLCNGGPITVLYDPEQPCEQGVCYGGERSGSRTLTIYDNGTGSVANALFTLAHESSHIYQSTTTADSGMLEDPGVLSELPIFSGNLVTGICTYPLDWSDSPGLQVPFTENFAEAIALIIAGPNPVSVYRDMGCLGGPFSSVLPNTYQYILNEVF